MTQRLRVRFRKGERVRYISHLDVLRYWERAIRRAGLPLAYSQGFTPHPRLAFAGPLPLGFTSEGEVMDVTLTERTDVDEFRERLEGETSQDLRLLDVVEVAPSAPAPQAAILWADYSVELPAVPFSEAERAVTDFLARDTFPWTEERKEGKTREYDLRAAVPSLRAEPMGEGSRLVMRLQSDKELTARPEQLLAAILPGTEADIICRLNIVLEDTSPARDAWRRVGQYQ